MKQYFYPKNILPNIICWNNRVKRERLRDLSLKLTKRALYNFIKVRNDLYALTDYEHDHNQQQYVHHLHLLRHTNYNFILRLCRCRKITYHKLNFLYSKLILLQISDLVHFMVKCCL